MFQARRKHTIDGNLSFGLVSADSLEEVLALLDDFGHIVQPRRDYVIETYQVTLPDGFVSTRVREVLYLI